jgi:Domain of unknown function (DUF4124)
MHPWKSWIVLAAFAACVGQAAVVYKWTDSEGVVHYSDQPAPGAEKMFTTSSTSANGAATASRSGASGAATAKKNGAPGLAYTQFSITAPTPDQSFFGDDVIGVHLSLDPDLMPGHTLTWRLNGQQLDDIAPPATQFSLPRLDRGTYVITATITDRQTGESSTTPSVSFFVRQPSALSPLHQKP